jgi:hypothetical protein
VRTLITIGEAIKIEGTKMSKNTTIIEQDLAGTYFAEATNGFSFDFQQELIRKRAYELYLARGGTPDRSLDDWLQAEREINHHLSA